jgi:DNA transposition AAA+ family ATPase
METFKHDESIRSALEQYYHDHDLSHAELAALVGATSGTRIGKYLALGRAGRTPERDAPKVEAAARAFLLHARRRDEVQANLFSTSVSRSMARIFKQVRETGDVALIHSHGGTGKTCGAQLFCADNPNALLITAKQYACRAGAICDMLFDEVQATVGERWTRNCRKALWIEKVLRGTERIIVVDNAQRLHISAFYWLFDLHDATLCPIALIGNPEVLQTIKLRDPSGQLKTRIGFVRKVGVKKDEAEIATGLLRQVCPEAEEELKDLASDVVALQGGPRTLRKQLSLTKTLKSAGAGTWALCFAKAAKNLINSGKHQEED